MSTLGSFIWSIADQLRGPYRPNQYGNVILPLTILRRLDCILAPDRETVRDLAAKFDNPNRLKVEVKKATGRTFYNTSNYSFANLLKDADGLADNLNDYIDRFSPDVDVFEYFDFKKEIVALEKAELLREVAGERRDVDGAAAERPEAAVAGLVAQIGVGVHGAGEDALARHLDGIAAIGRAEAVGGAGQEGLDARDLGAADLEQQAFLQIQPAIAGEGLRLGGICGMGRRRAASFAVHASTSLSAVA